jgi:cell division septation protein DedD
MASGNIKNFELKLGRTGLVILIAGVTALLCSAFIFGVTVGKNIDSYPEKIASFPQRVLALVWRPAKIRAAQNAADNKGVQNQSKSPEELGLTFYNTLTSKKGAVKEQPIADKKPVAEAPINPQLLPQPKNEPVPAATPAAEAPKPPAAKSEAAVDAIEAKIKEAQPAVAVNKGKYAVQVASSKEKSKASQMGKKISTLGFTPSIVETNIPEKGRWFRIVVYGFPGKAQAQAAAEKISKKTGTRCVVKLIDVAANKN